MGPPVGRHAPRGARSPKRPLTRRRHTPPLQYMLTIHDLLHVIRLSPSRTHACAPLPTRPAESRTAVRTTQTSPNFLSTQRLPASRCSRAGRRNRTEDLARLGASACDPIVPRQSHRTTSTSSARSSSSRFFFSARGWPEACQELLPTPCQTPFGPIEVVGVLRLLGTEYCWLS